MAGDVVGGYDHTLKKYAWGVVKATKKSIKRGLVSLFAAGTLIAQPTLEHPVWTENHNDYVAAQDLKIGDIFLDGKGVGLRLDSLVIKLDTTLTVYNFGVNDLHNYYVGTQEVLVHNTCAKLKLLRDNLATLGLSEANITKFVEALKEVSDKGDLTDGQRQFLHEQLNNLTELSSFVSLVNSSTADFKAILLKIKVPPINPLADGAHGFNAWKIVKKLNLAETEKYVKALARDLNKRVDLVADILDNAQSRELWKLIVDDPSKAIQKVKESIENLDLTNSATWKSLGNSAFWQDFINGPGKKFETNVVTSMITDVADSRLTRLKAFITRGYTHNTQVYLKRVDADGNILSGTKPIVVDNLLTGEKATTGLREWNGVFNDAKLTDKAGWTDNQLSELINLFDGGATEIRFQVRSIGKTGLPQNNYLIIKKENVFKTQSSLDGTTIRTLLENNEFDKIKISTTTKPVF